MNKSFKLLPPLMPNFIAYEVPARSREEGFKPESNRLAVGDLSKEEAEQYGELMKRTFIEHWEKKSKLNPPEPPNDRVYNNTWETAQPPKLI